VVVKTAHGRRTMDLAIAAGNASPSFPNSTMYPESLPIERDQQVPRGRRAAAPPSTAPGSRSIGLRAVGIRPLEKQKFLRVRTQSGTGAAANSAKTRSADAARPRGTGFTRRPVYAMKHEDGDQGLPRYPGSCTCTRTNSEAREMEGPACTVRSHEAWPPPPP